MNVFKSLDAIFPTGSARTVGEVVGVNVAVSIHDKPDARKVIQMKRKAWYVNASVNAFHMHRSLVRDLMDTQVRLLSPQLIRRAKRLIVLGVLTAYLQNRKTGEQSYSFVLDFYKGLFDPEGRLSVTLWWVYTKDGSDQWVEVYDNGMDLQTQVDIAVLQTKGIAHPERY